MTQEDPKDPRVAEVVDVSVPGSVLEVKEVRLTEAGRRALSVPASVIEGFRATTAPAADEAPCVKCGERDETDVIDPVTGLCDMCTRKVAALLEGEKRRISMGVAATDLSVVPGDLLRWAPGYHTRPIKKGVLGEVSKIREEVEELEDAAEQGVVIMELVELADLYGAMRARVERLGHTMADLEKMADVTARAFRNGRR